MEANRVLLVHFVEVMTSDIFKKKFLLIKLGVKHVLDWVIKVDIPAAMSLYKITKEKADTLSKPLEKSMSARSPDLVLKEIGIEQVRQILRLPNICRAIWA